jgi:hypothetical protein
MPKSTKSTGNFQPLEAKAKYRLVVRSWGPDKVGKNHFGFTGPAPIYGQYFDPGGTEGVAEKFLEEGKDIRAIQYRFDKSRMNQTEAQEMRDQFIEDYELALDNARTVQWDETEVWELFRWAEFGADSDAPRFYAPLNARYRFLLQSAYDAGVNLQLIQKVKEKWGENSKGKPTPLGIFEPTGFKECNYIVQANLEHRWDAENGFHVHVVNSRQNMALAGQVYAGLDWSTLGTLVFPTSTEDDWV